MEPIIRAVYRFGRASQHLWLVTIYDGCSDSLALTMPASLAPEPHDAWSFRHPLTIPAAPVRTRVHCPDSFIPDRCQPRMCRWATDDGTSGSFIRTITLATSCRTHSLLSDTSFTSCCAPC